MTTLSNASRKQKMAHRVSLAGIGVGAIRCVECAYIAEFAVFLEQSSQAIDGTGFADTYNDLLDRAQKTFPDNDVIQSLEEVQSGGRPVGTAQAVQRVRSNTSRLADALGIDLSDLEDDPAGELQPIELTVSHDVDMAQQQAQRQQQEQYVDVDTILEDVDRATVPPDEREELFRTRGLVRHARSEQPPQ